MQRTESNLVRTIVRTFVPARAPGHGIRAGSLLGAAGLTVLAMSVVAAVWPAEVRAQAHSTSPACRGPQAWRDPVCLDRGTGRVEVTAVDGTFLGCLNCAPWDPDSVFNPNGEHGRGASAVSLWSRGNPYGNAFSSTSACVASPFSRAPRVAQEFTGRRFGVFSISTTAPEGVCNPTQGNAYAPATCALAREMCASRGF